MIHIASDLEQLFANCFFERYHTVLIGGFDEPFYQASINNGPAQIHYRADYFASALHEIAHWCLAGEQRRDLNDYGYWYQAQRNSQQQQAFEAVEIKPQAIECLFSRACNFPFKVSADNLELTDYSNEHFADQVELQVQSFIEKGNLPQRSKLFIEALEHHYHFGAALENTG